MTPQIQDDETTEAIFEHNINGDFCYGCDRYPCKYGCALRDGDTNEEEQC
jgi:hypothetical protein